MYTSLFNFIIFFRSAYVLIVLGAVQTFHNDDEITTLDKRV